MLSTEPSKYPIVIITGTSNPAIASRIGRVLGIPLVDPQCKRFADVQSLCPPDVNSAIMELLLMIDACQRASAKRVVAVIPYYGYSRQDRKAAPRMPISAKLVADMIITAGADRVLSVELHASQIQGFFPSRVQMDHIYGLHVFAPHLNKIMLGKGDITVVSPDAGGIGRARALATRIGAEIVIVDKRRERANECEVMNVIGNVHGHHAIIYDDIADTAGTLVNAAAAIKREGAKTVIACVSHALLSRDACEKLRASVIDELICLDTVPVAAEKLRRSGNKITVLSVAEFLALAIDAVHSEKSIGDVFTRCTPHISIVERAQREEIHRLSMHGTPPDILDLGKGDESSSEPPSVEDAGIFE